MRSDKGDDDAADADEDDSPRQKSARAAKGKAKSAAEAGVAKKNDKKGKSGKVETRSRGLGRLTRFVREVVAELRKVIWPTRKELITYAVVVIFFVAVILAIVGGLDYGFAKGALWVFGTGSNN
ncbi:MAG: preprotein translocase subunit SecE [Actinocatenispora sp.]